MNFFQDLKQKIEKGVETAGQKSQRMIAMSSLNLKIKGKKEDIDRLMKKLGWDVYRAWEPNKILEISDQVQDTLKAVHDLNVQLKELEKELEELKSLNITNKDTAERVTIPPVPEETVPTYPPPSMPDSNGSHSEPKQSNKSRATPAPVVPPPTAVVYICPFCAHQVECDISSCSHCHRRYY